jgi:hypothetical protein
MRRTLVSFTLLAAILTGCGGGSSSHPLATQPGAGTYPTAFREASQKACGKQTEEVAHAFGGQTACGCVIQRIEEDIPASQFRANEESGYVDALIKTASESCGRGE